MYPEFFCYIQHWNGCKAYVYLRHATPSRAGSAYSLDVVGRSSPYPTASKIEEALVKEPAEKKSRPSQHTPTVPAARKSIPSVKGEFSTREGGKVSAPLPKSPPLPPPKVEVQSKSPSSAVPPPAVKPIPAPSVPPKAAGQHKRDSNMVDGGGPTKKATPPKTPSPSKVGAPIPPVAQHVKHEVRAKPVATPSRAESKATKSDLGVSASQAPTVPGDAPAPETQLDSQQSSQGQQGDGGYDGSKVETNVPAETTHAAAATRAPPDNTATTPTAPKQVTPPHVTPTQATPPPPKVTATPPPPKVTATPPPPKVPATPPPPKVPATPPSVKKPAVPKFSENESAFLSFKLPQAQLQLHLQVTMKGRLTMLPLNGRWQNRTKAFQRSSSKLGMTQWKATAAQPRMHSSLSFVKLVETGGRFLAAYIVLYI